MPQHPGLPSFCRFLDVPRFEVFAESCYSSERNKRKLVYVPFFSDFLRSDRPPRRLPWGRHRGLAAAVSLTSPLFLFSTSRLSVLCCVLAVKRWGVPVPQSRRYSKRELFFDYGCSSEEFPGDEQVPCDTCPLPQTLLPPSRAPPGCLSFKMLR